MGIYRTLRVWGLNAINTVVYVASGGTRTLHEGRYELGRWTNWNRETAAWPRVFAQPTTEADICAVVRDAKRLRVVGSGHTFGDQPVSSDTILSLDRYCGLISVDEARRRLRVQAGMRLRDLHAAGRRCCRRSHRTPRARRARASAAASARGARRR